MDIARRQQLLFTLLKPAMRALPWHLGQCRLRHEL
jgi:hypothetical protein